jgi:hypothetical protein
MNSPTGRFSAPHPSCKVPSRAEREKLSKEYEGIWAAFLHMLGIFNPRNKPTETY